MRLELAHRTRALPTERVNGDAVWISTWIHRPVFAVIDGSGHGEAAHDAARQTCAALQRWDGTLDMPALVERLHRELRGTRGCAITVGILDGAVLRGFGVGNVQLRAVERTVTALLTPGILGVRLRRRVHIFDIPLEVGDRLVVTTDGVRPRFEPDVHAGLSPADLCDSLLREHARPLDDATVLVADVLHDHE